MSVAANKAKGRRSYDETMDLVRGLRAAPGAAQAVDGLTADQWERLACLMGYSQPASRWAETAVQALLLPRAAFDALLAESAPFRDFVFANAARLWGGQNPAFFDGTAVEGDVRKLLDA